MFGHMAHIRVYFSAGVVSKQDIVPTYHIYTLFQLNKIINQKTIKMFEILYTQVSEPEMEKGHLSLFVTMTFLCNQCVWSS